MMFQPKPKIRPIILLVILGIVIAGYFVSAKYLNLWPFHTPVTNQQIVDGTANWKTYRNEVGGWLIRVPNDWASDLDTISLVGPLPSGQNSSIEFASPTSGYAIFSITTIISRDKNQTIKSPDGYNGNLESFISTLKSSGQLKSIVRITVDSEPAYGGVNRDGITEIYSEHKNNLYIFLTKSDNLALKALSTFKFTK